MRKTLRWRALSIGDENEVIADTTIWPLFIRSDNNSCLVVVGRLQERYLSKCSRRAGCVVSPPGRVSGLVIDVSSNFCCSPLGLVFSFHYIKRHQRGIDPKLWTLVQPVDLSDHHRLVIVLVGDVKDSCRRYSSVDLVVHESLSRNWFTYRVSNNCEPNAG